MHFGLVASDASVVLFPAIGMLVACFTLLGYGVTQSRVNQAYRRQVRQAEAALCPHLVGSDRLDLEVFDAMGDYGRGPVLEVLRSARRQLKGRCADAIAESLRDLGEVARLERAAHSSLRSRRLAALWGLGECGGSEAERIISQALSHADSETRVMARESALLIGTEEIVLEACQSLLAENEREFEASLRFVRWVCTRFPKSIETLLEERKDLSPFMRQSFENALHDSLGWRAEASFRAVQQGLDTTGGESEAIVSRTRSSIEPGRLSRLEVGRSIERIVLAAGALGRAHVINDDWLDSRTQRLDTSFGLRMVASEVAFGLALLTGAIAGGGLAWLIYG